MTGKATETAREDLYASLRWRLLFGASKALHRASNWFYAKAVRA